MQGQQQNKANHKRQSVGGRDADPAVNERQGALGNSQGSAGVPGPDAQGQADPTAPQRGQAQRAKPTESADRMDDERRGLKSSQGLAGAQGSGGGAERGITQNPDRGDVTSGPG